MTHQTKVRPINEIKVDLKKAKDRLEEVRRRGDKAIGECDLMYGHNAKYYLKKGSLLFNHISYYQRELKEAHGGQLSLFTFQ